MKHRTATAPLTALILAGFLLAGSGCAAPQSAPAPGTAAPSESAAASGPSASETQAPEASAMKTFTFPDGHLSFEYRGDWSVNTIEEPSRPGAAKSGPVEAIISDADGNRVISIVSGSAADDAAGEPVTRSILDMEPVMALQAADGETPVLGLAVDTDADGKITTHFDVRGVTDFVSETGTSGTNRVKLGNGFMAATAILPDRGQIFKTESAARDWTASEGYRHTRALFLSLKYT